MTWAVGAQAEYQTPGAYSPPNLTSRPVAESVADVLSGKHRRMLFEESGISPKVAAERGTFTAWRGADVPQEHGKLPKTPGMVFPVHTLDGGISHRLRLDNPGELPKYMQPKGAPNRLDIHPRQHERIKRPGGMRYATEGERKVDAGVSRGLLMVGMPGVFNGQRDKGAALIDDWYLLPLEGERYSILFDSDIAENPMVQLAADRMARLLRERGAEVFITLLPPAPDGSKQGLDDFFANGGTVKEIELLTQPYEPLAIERARLSRDEKLRALVDDLRAGWWIEGWKGRGSKVDRDIALKLIEAATRSGKPHRDGIRVKVSWGVLKVEAKVSPRTLSKAVARLEDRGFLFRDNEGRKGREAGAFVLRANVNRKGVAARKEAQELRGYDPCGIHSRALPTVPRLWASRPKWKPTKKMIHEHRMGVRTWLPEPHERIERLGKTRGAALDFLEAAGRLMTKQEMADALHCRARDLVRRKKPGSKGRDGVLVMLIDTGIIEVEGDVFRLAAEWREKLNVARRDGGEVENDERAETHRKRKSEDYREWLAGKAPASKPTAAGLAAVERSKAKRAEHLAEQERRRTQPDTEELERRRFVKRYVFDQVKSRIEAGLSPIRLELLQGILFDDGGTPSYAVPAARSLGCTIERLPEFGMREFVIPPIEWRAAG